MGSILPTFLKSFFHRIRESAGRAEWQQLKKRLRQLVGIFITGLIIYQLFRIGWGDVLQELPTHPLFYLIFLLLFFSLPAAELLIYRRFWKIQRRELFKVFLAKRIYNEEVVGYSGEVYLVMWAKARTSFSTKKLTKQVRDNNILSAGCSYVMALLLLIFLVSFEIINPAVFIPAVDSLTVWLITAAVIVLGVLGWKYRAGIYSLGKRTTAIVFSIYAGRFVLHHMFLVFQWMVVLPDIPVTTWLIFVGVIIVVNRLPFLPSKDLIFMWAGIELSGLLNMAVAPVAGMLLVSSAMNKLMNAALYFYVTGFAKEKFTPPAAVDNPGKQESGQK